MEWQPIETAPKDTPVLIYDGSMICAASWDWLFSETSPHIVAGKPNSKYWTCVGASGWECENDFEEPTYWMPLPPKPAD